MQRVPLKEGMAKWLLSTPQLFPTEGVSAIQIEGIILIRPIPPCLSTHIFFVVVVKKCE